MKHKLKLGSACVLLSALALIPWAGAHRRTSAALPTVVPALDPGTRTPHSVVSPSTGIVRRAAKPSPAHEMTPEEKQAEEDEWVVAYDPAPGRAAEVVWQKEEGDSKVTLDESGIIMVTSKLSEHSNLTPEQMAQLPATQRLTEEAKQEMHTRLPMVPRADWEEEQRERALAASDVRSVDPNQFGYASMTAMKEAYRSKFGVPDGEDFSLNLRKNDTGQFELEAKVSGIALAERDSHRRP